MIKNPKDYFCILGGGGIRGMCYLGVLRAFRELNLNIKGWAGSSVGSIIAALKGVNTSDEYIENFFMNFSPDIFKDINLDFRNGLGFSKGEKFLNWIRDAIEENYYGEKYVKGKMDAVRFKDIDTNLIILSTNLSDSTFKEFSRHKTPHIEIAQAVRASISIPGLFQPVEIGNEIFVDGDLTKTWPLWRLSENICFSDCRVLEYRLEDLRDNKKIDNSITFLNAVYNTISGLATDFLIDLYSKKDGLDYIKINSNGISFADFLINKKQKLELEETGYNTTMTYFKEFLPKKRENLKEVYANIYQFLYKIQEETDSKNFERGSAILGELFMYMYDLKDCLEVDIYKNLLGLRDLFKENTRHIKLLGVHVLFLNNRESVKAKLKEIIEILYVKTCELSEKII